MIHFPFRRAKFTKTSAYLFNISMLGENMELKVFKVKKVIVDSQ